MAAWPSDPIGLVFGIARGPSSTAKPAGVLEADEHTLARLLDRSHCDGTSTVASELQPAATSYHDSVSV